MPIQYSLNRVNTFSRDVLEFFNYQGQDDHSLYNNVCAILSAGEANTGSSYHIEQTKMLIWCQKTNKTNCRCSWLMMEGVVFLLYQTTGQMQWLNVDNLTACILMILGHWQIAIKT